MKQEQLQSWANDLNIAIKDCLSYYRENQTESVMESAYEQVGRLIIEAIEREITITIDPDKYKEQQ
jgi:hypothetical protein